MDVREPSTFDPIVVEEGDIVYHFAARLLVPILPRKERHDYFWQALYVGTQNVFDWMEKNELRNLVYYTTDMVYGHTEIHPRTEEHPCKPIGPYGEAKYQTELMCDKYRKQGFNITLFRPRLIIGHGRLGILEKLFILIDKNLPVPTIGPPTVNELLRQLIDEAGSKSFLLPTPAFAVKAVLAMLDKIGKPIMDPEQYLIADETCVLDCSKAERDLGWTPKDSDIDMLLVAYHDYKAGKSRLS